MYFSIGAHPGFRCPMLPQEQLEDYYLEFENDLLEITQLHEGLRTPDTKRLPLLKKQLPLSSNLFNNDALVLEGQQVNQIVLKSNLHQHSVTLICKNWPFFGIWSKKGNQDFICLEPWFGIADANEPEKDFTNKKGILKLEANKHFACEYTLVLK